MDHAISQDPSTEDARWRLVLDRLPSGDFVYAVTTTGVYCRPGCSSRTPRRANVRFFDTGRAAEAGAAAPTTGASSIRAWQPWPRPAA